MSPSSPSHLPPLSSSSSSALRPSILAQAPQLAPPASSARGSSPSRRPLQERSGAQTNQHPRPTIRIVADGEDNSIYLKYATPSQPSHILPPPRHAPPYEFERSTSRVSNGSQVASTVAKFEAGQSQPPLHAWQRRKRLRHSTSTRTSDTDTLVASSFSPSSASYSQRSTPPSSPPPPLPDWEQDSVDGHASPPARPERSTIRPVSPSSSGGESVDGGSGALTASVAALAHVVSARPFTPVRHARGQAEAAAATMSATGLVQSASTQAGDHDHPRPVLKSSVESFTYSDISCTSVEPSHSPSTPILHQARLAPLGGGLRIHYPQLRSPSASSLRAQSQLAPSIASRMQDRSLAHQWSSQLSTIASVSEPDSHSQTRLSRSTRARSPSEDSWAGSGRIHAARTRRQTIGSLPSSSDDVSSEGHTEYSAVPRPLFSPVSRASSSQERDSSSEHLDTISPLPSSAPLRMKSSGCLPRHLSDAASVRSATDSRPGSAQSDVSTFIHNNIPAWARVYYRRGERISVGPPESDSSGSVRLGTSHSGRSHTPSESNYPFSIYRPRNRPHHRASRHETMSVVDEIQPIDGDVYILGPDMRPLSGIPTLHLGHDRRGRMLYSAWQAPSLDEDLNTSLFERRNRQILLFCLGFLFPFAWIIASFLPLPEPSAVMYSPSQADLEQQFVQRVAPIDDKAFQKATWWRNLNRIMAGIGTLLIGVIITLAVLISRMPTRT